MCLGYREHELNLADHLGDHKRALQAPVAVRSHIVGAPCTGHGGLLDQFQLWDIEGSTPAPAPTPSPPTPCGKPCKEDKDCNGKGGFFGNTCLVAGTRCAGHCAKRD